MALEIPRKRTIAAVLTVATLGGGALHEYTTGYPASARDCAANFGEVSREGFTSGNVIGLNDACKPYERQLKADPVIYHEIGPTIVFQDEAGRDQEYDLDVWAYNPLMAPGQIERKIWGERPKAAAHEAVADVKAHPGPYLMLLSSSLLVASSILLSRASSRD